jgi:hypothetical protein
MAVTILGKVVGASRHLLWYVDFHTGNAAASRSRLSSG